MSFKSMRVILVAALVAALFGGSVATARTLISGKDIRTGAVSSTKIKDGSILGKDIKSRTISLSKLSSGTQKLIRAKGGAAGAPGPAGAKGATGANGANGAQGPQGPTGPGVDLTNVNAATWISFGFSRWRDSAADSTIAFGASGLVIGSPSQNVYGVNLPFAEYSKLSDVAAGTLAYTGNAVLRLEVSTDGNDLSAGGNYATFYYATPEYKDGGDVTKQSTPLTGANWHSSKALTGIDTTSSYSLAQLLTAAPNARVVFASLGGGSTTKAAASPTTVTVKNLQIGFKGAPTASYTFGG